MAVYLVTGIAGFIGSSIARALLDRGDQVRGIDNFSTGKRENIAPFRDRITFIEADIADPKAAAEACRGTEYVFHEAALPSVPRSVEDPIGSNHNNVTGTLELLVAARDAGVRRFVYAGSSAAYGETPELPKLETMTPSPISPYAVSKLTGEHYLTCFYRVYGFETVTLRYFNVFGPYQAADSMYSGVLAKFITMMLRGQQPTIFGDGEQSRDFTYIDNVVHGNLLAAAAPSTVAGEVFNVATNSQISLNDTFNVLKRIIGYEGEPAYAAERGGDIKHSRAGIAKAEAFLGYQPLVSFEEGLERTVEWYRTQEKPAAASGD